MAWRLLPAVWMRSMSSNLRVHQFSSWERNSRKVWKVNNRLLYCAVTNGSRHNPQFPSWVSRSRFSIYVGFHIFSTSASVLTLERLLSSTLAWFSCCLLGLWTNPCCYTPTSLIPVGSPLLKTPVVEQLGSALLGQTRLPRLSLQGQAFSCRLGPESAPPLSWVMGIQGMELFAIGVVIILFMAVLKQFGILEPMSSFEGKGRPEVPQLANRFLQLLSVTKCAYNPSLLHFTPLLYVYIVLKLT